MASARRRQLLACMPGLAGLLALLPSARVAAEPRLLRAAVIQVEPYGVIDAQGRHSGAYADVFEMLGKEIGRDIDVLVAPYARSLVLLQTGKVDMMIAMPSSAIAEVALPAGGVWELEAIAIGRADTQLHQLSDLRGRTVARIRGTNYGPDFMDDKSIHHYEMTSHVQGLKMLFEKRIDAVVGGRPGIFYAMRKLGIRREQLGSSFAVQVREVQLHLSKRLADPQVAAELRRGMAALRASGRIDAVIVKYSAGLPRD